MKQQCCHAVRCVEVIHMSDLQYQLILSPQKFLLYDEVATAYGFTKDGMMTTVTARGKFSSVTCGYKMDRARSGVLRMNTYATENATCMDATAYKEGIRVASVTAKWTEDFPDNTLTSVSLDVKPGGLVAVIGPVGSGKVSYSCRKGTV